MKLPALLLAGSIAVNAVLLGLAFAKPELAPPSVRPFFAFSSSAPPAATPAKPRAPRAEPVRQLWSTLASDDLPTLIARLRAAGFPASIIRQIVMAELSARYEARLRRIYEPDGNQPFWKQSANSWELGSKRMEEYYALQRERTKVMRDLLGGDFFASDDVSAAQRRQFGNLPRSKIDLLQRVEDDYAEMMSAVRSASNGIMLADDNEKLALLLKEKHADLAAILTPDELADYELRSSPITNLLRNRLNKFEPTEAEFRAIYATQQELNDKFPYRSGAVTDFTQRQEFMKSMNDQLRQSLGEARYNEFNREVSPEYQLLSRLAQRDNLPADTALRAYNVRDSVATESNRIFDDATLDNDQKRAALKTLAQNTRNQLVTLLGPAAGQAYVNSINNQWLGQVERGSAVSFTGGGSSMSISSVNNSGPVTVSLGTSPTYRRVSGPPAPRP